jgi:fatty-acyl-CoA synthase
MTAGVPTVWMAMLAAIDAQPARWDLSALDRLVVGGAAVPRSMLEGFDSHGLTVIRAWGMTETAPLGSVCRVPDSLDESDAEEQYNYRVRQGIPSPLFDIRARDDAGQLIEWDDAAIGELVVRGPWALGRGRLPPRPGWRQLHPGRLVQDRRRSPHRCPWLHPDLRRSKDLVKSRGEWISSVDLENQLMAHPAVAQAAVIAVPDSRWGERPLAVVSLRAGAQTSPTELREHLAQQFAKWQVPDRFEFVAAIPCTATGKFKKTQLRDQLAPA